MNLKFTGPVIDTMTDKRGTLYLIIEERTTGQPVPQKVQCYTRPIADIARNVHVGDVVSVEVTLSANRWDPPDGRPRVWFDGLKATFIEVGQPRTLPPPPPSQGDDDVPF